MRTLATVYGEMTAPDWTGDLILRALAEHGEWGYVETALLAPLVQPQDRFWDVGAFLGTFTLGLAAHRTPASVVAIEPNPALGPCLERNLRLNLSCPATVLAEGVAREDGWIRPERSEDVSNHGAQGYAAAEPGDGIRCRSLRSLRREFGDYDVLKIDAEGMEHDILRGDLDHLKATKPVLWIECNEDRRSLRILGALRWLGYDPVYLAYPAFRADNHKRATDLIYPMAYEATLLAARPDRLQYLNPTLAGADIICRSVANAYDLRRALYDTPRWSRVEWLNLSRAELLARLGRYERNEIMADFLSRSTTHE